MNTIGLGDASKRRWDAAIVGAGPAGAMMALLLARRGWRVLLIERSAFPRNKVCGYCLNQAGAGVLRRAGVAEILNKAPRLHLLRLRHDGRQIDFDVPASLCVPREVLDAGLARHAIAAGAQFISECNARLVHCDGIPPFRTLKLCCRASQATIEASLVMACDGIGGTLLDQHPQCRWSIASDAWIGVSLTLARAYEWAVPGAITLHAAPRGYVGAVRLSDGRTHLAAALDPAACRRAGGAANLIQQVIPADIASARLHGTPLLTRRRRRLGAHRVLALGDACGYVEPFTGEGMTWALRSAESLAALLGDGPDCWDWRLPDRWAQRHRMLLGWHQALCHGVRHILHNPAAAATAFAIARRAPLVAGALARLISRSWGKPGDHA